MKNRYKYKCYVQHGKKVISLLLYYILYMRGHKVPALAKLNVLGAVEHRMNYYSQIPCKEFLGG